MLENEDVKLDNMFIASLIADIIRGMIYLHESPLKYHGSLCTSNCLIDSRWVVKLSDFGLQAFKKGAEDPNQTIDAKCQSKCFQVHATSITTHCATHIHRPFDAINVQNALRLLLF